MKVSLNFTVLKCLLADILSIYAFFVKNSFLPFILGTYKVSLIQRILMISYCKPHGLLRYGLCSLKSTWSSTANTRAAQNHLRLIFTNAIWKNCQKLIIENKMNVVANIFFLSRLSIRRKIKTFARKDKVEYDLLMKTNYLCIPKYSKLGMITISCQQIYTNMHRMCLVTVMFFDKKSIIWRQTDRNDNTDGTFNKQ